MSIITILGVRAMGSAIAIPLIDVGHRVRLWGTHLDDHLIAVIRSRDSHPHTGAVVPLEVTSYLPSDVDVAMASANVTVPAVSSSGVVDITRLVALFLADVHAVWLTSKGLAPDGSGRAQLLPQVMGEVLTQEKTHTPPIVATDGLCEANGVASCHFTAPIFIVVEAPEHWARTATARQRRVVHTTDRDGVELCAALKNVYVIALGIVGGMSKLGDQPFHDLKAAAFTQALAELWLLLDAKGADLWTTLGPASTGDLEVTDLSRRNEVYGMRIGDDECTDGALAEMTAAEQTVEGVPVVEFTLRFVQQRHPRLTDDLPLLAAVHAAVHQGRIAGDIEGAALSL